MVGLRKKYLISTYCWYNIWFRYETEMQGSEVYEERLRNKKLNKLVEAGFAC